MRFAVALVLLCFVNVAFLYPLFKPGFISPDLVLVALISRAYLTGRESVLWAVLGGSALDLLTDNIGLNLSSEVISVYLFVLITEKILIRNLFTFLIPSAILLILKKIFSLLLVSVRFSFEISFMSVMFAWIVEILLLGGVYFFYLKKRE